MQFDRVQSLHFSEMCVLNSQAINFFIWSVRRVWTATWWLEKNIYWVLGCGALWALCSMCVCVCVCLMLHVEPQLCMWLQLKLRVCLWDESVACLQGCSAGLGGGLQRWWDRKLNSVSGSHHQIRGGQQSNFFSLSAVLSISHFLAGFLTSL